MIRIIVFVICLLLGQLLNAQNASVLKGKIQNDQGEALSFVTIAVQNAEGENIFTTFSEEDGSFQFDNTENAKQLKFNYVGYQEQILTVKDNLFFEVVMEESSELLDEVTIIAQKPTIKREVDRLVFNVQNTALATSNAWEIVKQAPGINAVGDNLTIRNQGNIVVTINDRKVLLSGEQLKAMLESTDGNLVESVEIITNPPAKYEAEGNAVLNIKLKKNNLLGYKGSIHERFKQSQYAYNTLSTNHLYSTEKVNIMADYSFGKGTAVRKNIDNVIYQNGEMWSSEMIRKNKVLGTHSFQLNADIHADSTFTVSFGGNGYINSGMKGKYVVPTLIYNSQNQIESHYTTNNDRKATMDTYTGYLMLDKNWQKKQQLIWSNYFTYDNQNENQNVLTQLNFKNQQPSTQNYLSLNKAHTRLVVSALDYTAEQWGGKLESGVKYSFVEAKYRLNFWDDESGVLEYRDTKSNVFQYQELNWAGYTSYQKQIGRWGIKAGLRTEYTGIQTENADEKGKQSYLEWFPTFYVKYDLTDEQQLGFSYGKRISRPSYSWMNPAKSYYNMFSYFQGDADLKPAIRHNLNLNYTWNQLDVEVFYNYEKNPSMEISYQEEETKMLVYNYTNIEKRQYSGLIVSFNQKLWDWWSLNGYSYLQYQEDYFYGKDNLLYKNDALIFGGRFYASFELNKKNNWKAMLIYGFYTPTVQGTFKISGAQTTDLAMSRDFAEEKWQVNMTFNNIFRSDIQTISTQYADQNNYFIDYLDTRALTIGVKYNFGNQKVKNTAKEIDMEEKERL